jgi:hypothetical protein
MLFGPLPNSIFVLRHLPVAAALKRLRWFSAIKKTTVHLVKFAIETYLGTGKAPISLTFVETKNKC